MLIATENSTKLLSLLDSATKEYIFTVRLDGVSESFDLGTPINSHDITPRIRRTPEELREYLLSQTSQDTPRYSALHIDGQRAYDLARKGEIFDTPKRTIEVSEVEIIDYQESEITIRMVLSSG
jgi:tRNA pseudouridine55 synthase